MMANHPIMSVLTSIGTLTSRPAAFLVLLAYAALWLVFDRQSSNWRGAATLVSWARSLFIQRAKHCDTGDPRQVGRDTAVHQRSFKHHPYQ
jgi:hypothetical protein